MTRPSVATWSSEGRISPSKARSVTSNTAPKPVRGGLVGSEQPERLAVARDHVPQERAQDPGGLAGRPARRRHVDRVVAEVRQREVAQEQASVGVRVGAHPPVRLAVAATRARRSARPTRRTARRAGSCAASPPGACRWSGFVADLAHRHLVGAERSLRRQAVDHPWAGPALGRAQDDHRPASAGPSRRPSRASRWIVAISSTTWSIVRAIAWCISAGSSPSTKYGW